MTERQSQIMDLLEKEKFISVRRLSQVTFTSESSIRRDLSDLQKRGLVRRTHGGVAAADASNRLPPLANRMEKNPMQKRLIAKRASAFLQDGQVVMLDGSSTAGFLVPYLAQRQGIVLYTNNMNTALQAIESGVETHCIGGCSVNRSAALAGEEAYRALESLRPDLLFFSSQSLDAEGNITDSNIQENHLRLKMLEGARRKIFLCDSEKFNRSSTYFLTNLSHLDGAVFDTAWSPVAGLCPKMLP